ncbi:MAG: response regulator transcription factor, partial [Pedobacter sp.]
MIDCIIVDDEEHAIEVIQHYLKAVPSINVTANFTSPVDAIGYLSTNKIDLVFLDIHMPDISGIDFIQSLNNKQLNFILTTAYKEFANIGFDLGVVDYLVKPIPLPRFLQAVSKAQTVISALKNGEPISKTITNYIIVKTEAKGKLLKINIADIDFIEGMKNYVAFHHNGIRTMALLAMKDVEDRLPKDEFIRVQKSFIISVNKITAIDGNRIILKGISTEILIGETYRRDFID